MQSPRAHPSANAPRVSRVCISLRARCRTKRERAPNAKRGDVLTTLYSKLTSSRPAARTHAPGPPRERLDKYPGMHRGQRGQDARERRPRPSRRFCAAVRTSASSSRRSQTRKSPSSSGKVSSRRPSAPPRSTVYSQTMTRTTRSTPIRPRWRSSSTDLQLLCRPPVHYISGSDAARPRGTYKPRLHYYYRVSRMHGERATAYSME